MSRSKKIADLVEPTLDWLQRMTELLEHWPSLAAMGVLILLSAFFSASEAALFSLNVHDRRRVRQRGAAGRLAAGLLNDPERLLSAVLFWNLLINMTYFALASIIGAKLEFASDGGSSSAIAFTLVSLLTLIFLSEMLPKSFAVLAPVQLATLVGAPLAIAIKIVSPILPLVKVGNLAACRLIWPSFEPEAEIDLADIERAIEFGTDDAALRKRERFALQGLVEMADIRVDELMRPRSKLTIVSHPPDRSAFAQGVPQGGYLMLTMDEGETITAAIGVAMLRPSQLDDLPSAAEPVIYVGWTARVSQVLDLLHEDDRSVAVVVNEFGETIGAVSVDDILRRVLAGSGGRDDDAGGGAIQKIDDDCYRVAGSVSVRSLTKQLAIDTPDERTATVGGYLQRHNERRPRLGDVAPLENWELKVVTEDEDGVWIEARRVDNSQTDSRESES